MVTGVTPILGKVFIKFFFTRMKKVFKQLFPMTHDYLPHTQKNYEKYFEKLFNMG